MPAARSVLILTHHFDPTTDKVVDELNARDVAVFRVDTSEFPERLSVGAELTEGAWSGRLATTQARMGLGGLLASLQPLLNHPHAIGYAEYKPVQLQAAVGCGLRVPRTLVTNDPELARAFVADVGRAIYKPFGGSGVCDNHGHLQVFCTPVDADQCGDPSIARTMHLFQRGCPRLSTCA